MAGGWAREGRRRLVGKPWLDGGLRCRTKEAAVGYFGMLRVAVLGSCLDRSGRLDERKGLGEARGGRLKGWPGLNWLPSGGGKNPRPGWNLGYPGWIPRPKFLKAARRDLEFMVDLLLSLPVVPPMKTSSQVGSIIQ